MALSKSNILFALGMLGLLQIAYNLIQIRPIFTVENAQTTQHDRPRGNITIVEKNKNASITCPVKIFVYDLGFLNMTKELKKGFNSETIRKKSYTYITSKMMFGHGDHPWFIIQKFLLYTNCATKEAKEADFFILPLYDRDNNETNQVLETLELEFNNTLFRRSQKDHIIINFHNTKFGRELSQGLRDRTIELISPMVKVIVDVFLWGYDFKDRNKRKDLMYMNYDRLLTVVRVFAKLFGHKHIFSILFLFLVFVS